MLSLRAGAPRRDSLGGFCKLSPPPQPGASGVLGPKKGQDSAPPIPLVSTHIFPATRHPPAVVPCHLCRWELADLNPTPAAGMEEWNPKGIQGPPQALHRSHPWEPAWSQLSPSCLLLWQALLPHQGGCCGSEEGVGARWSLASLSSQPRGANHILQSLLVRSGPQEGPMGRRA